MAHGALREALAGKKGRHAFRVSDGGIHTSAMLSEPGVMLGEELFANDDFRDFI